jgi:hypothetical protein
VPGQVVPGIHGGTRTISEAVNNVASGSSYPTKKEIMESMRKQRQQRQQQQQQ